MVKKGKVIPEFYFPQKRLPLLWRNLIDLGYKTYPIQSIEGKNIYERVNNGNLKWIDLVDDIGHMIEKDKYIIFLSATAEGVNIKQKNLDLIVLWAAPYPIRWWGPSRQVEFYLGEINECILKLGGTYTIYG